MVRRKEAPTEETVDLTAVGGNAANALLGFVERHERLSEEIEGLTADRKEVMDEAKASGFDAATIRTVLKARKMGYGAYEERDALIQTYLDAVRQAEKAQTEKSKAEGV